MHALQPSHNHTRAKQQPLSCAGMPHLRPFWETPVVIRVLNSILVKGAAFALSQKPLPAMLVAAALVEAVGHSRCHADLHSTRSHQHPQRSSAQGVLVAVSRLIRFSLLGGWKLPCSRHACHGRQHSAHQ